MTSGALPNEARRRVPPAWEEGALTIEHIASLAEVSRSTVSRVLNEHPSVRPDVRARVLQVIREQHYTPKAAARSLASARTDTIGLLVPRSAACSLADPFIASMIQTLFSEATRQGFFAMLTMLTADVEPDFYDRILRARHFDGLIMFSSDIDDPILPRLIRDGGPLVLIGSHPYFLDVATVDAENRVGAHDAVAHLIELGHRRVGLINGQLEMEAAQARRDGYKQALLEAGLRLEPELMQNGLYSETAAYHAAQALLDLSPPPTAIFAASDHMAIGALHAVRNRGLHVPSDVAIIGFDDLPIAALSDPPLTSVHQPVDDMGAHAVRLLIEQIKGAGRPASVRVPTRLVVRESTVGASHELIGSKGGTAVAEGSAAALQND
jgi:LacI family transcriptional regulator